MIISIRRRGMKLFTDSRTATAQLEVWELISNFIPYIIGHVFIYSCWDLSYSLLEKRAHGMAESSLL